MFYSVYILYSTNTGKFYKGQTNNLSERLNRHNSGQVIATRNGRPWQLIWSTQKTDRAAAMELETKLKNMSVRKLLDFITKYHSDIIDQDLFLTLIHKFESRS